MGFLVEFTRSLKDDCLVLGVAKDNSLAERLEYSNWSILKTYILSLSVLSLIRYESSFLFGLFMIFHKLSSLIPSMKMLFIIVFRIYRFYQFIINLVQIGAFMLFSQIINIRYNTFIKNGKFKICSGNCCHSNRMFQIENFVFFIDYKDVGVLVKLSK